MENTNKDLVSTESIGIKISNIEKEINSLKTTDKSENEVNEFINELTKKLNLLNKDDISDEQKKNIKNLQEQINLLKSSEIDKLMKKLYNNVEENNEVNDYFTKFKSNQFDKIYDVDKFYEYYENIKFGILNKFKNTLYTVISGDTMYPQGFLNLSKDRFTIEINLIKTLFIHFQLKEQNETENFLNGMMITGDSSLKITIKNIQDRLSFYTEYIKNNTSFIHPKVALKVDNEYHILDTKKIEEIVKCKDTEKIETYFVYDKKHITSFIESMEGVMAVFRNIIFLKFCDQKKMIEKYSADIYKEYCEGHIKTIQDYIKFLNDNHLNEISNDEVSEIFNKYKEKRKILYEKKQKEQKKKAEEEQNKKAKTDNSKEIKTDKTEIDDSKDPGTIIFAISLVVITGVIIYFSFKNNSNNNDKDKKDNDNIDDDY